MRISIRVYPNAKVAKVGGRYGDGDPPILIVRVAEPALDGRANAAAIKLLASVLQVPASQIWIVSGHGKRNKIVELGETDRAILTRLLDGA